MEYYRVSLSNTTADTRMLMRAWCNSHLGVTALYKPLTVNNRWLYHYREVGGAKVVYVDFYSNEDATLFKLTWS